MKREKKKGEGKKRGWGGVGVVILGMWIGCGERGEPKGETGEERNGGFLRDSAYFVDLEVNPSPLAFGAGSPEELVDRALTAVAGRDTTTLADLAISAGEWREILYPEMGLHFPGARDSRVEVRDMLGELHFGSSVKGLRRLLRDYGGQRFERADLAIAGDTLRFPSYTLYTDPKLLLHTPEGAGGEVAFLGSFVEKDGVFKLLAYREIEAKAGGDAPGE